MSREYCVFAMFVDSDGMGCGQLWSIHKTRTKAIRAAKGSLEKWNRLVANGSDIVDRYPGRLESLEVSSSKTYLSLSA